MGIPRIPRAGTQNMAVLQLLVERGTITAYDILEHRHPRILGPRARICDLHRAYGYRIGHETVTVPTSEGHSVMVHRFFLQCALCGASMREPHGENVTGLCAKCLREEQATVGGAHEPEHAQDTDDHARLAGGQGPEPTPERAPAHTGALFDLHERP